MRRAELEKIDTLEDKIMEELGHLKKKRATMDEELAEFGMVEQLKVKAEKTKKYLEEQRQVLSGRKDLIKVGGTQPPHQPPNIMHSLFGTSMPCTGCGHCTATAYVC